LAADNISTHHPQFTGYPPKFTTHIPRPIQNF